MKRLEGVVLLGAITIVGALGISGSSSALEYQTNPSSGDNPVTLKFEYGSTLTINTDGNIAISNLTPGTANVSSSSYRVTVNTNNVAGYTLTATVGCSSGTNCYNNKTLSDGTNTFSMVTSTSGTTLTAGEWGFTTSGSATATSSVFKTLALYSDTTPTTLNKTKDATGTAYDNTFAGNTTTPFQIGAYATTSQVAGTYTNVINFSAVANPVPEYTVTLATSNANSIIIDGVSYTNGDTPTLTQGLHSISGTFPAGYEFSSWSSSGNVSIDNASSMDTTIDITGTGLLTLIGIKPAVTIATATYFQDVSSKEDGGCPNTLSYNEVYTLLDNRDNTSYKVARLKDGNCWMLQNLALDPTIVSLDDLKGNTNATDEIITFFKNGGGSSPYPASGVSSSWQTSYTLPYVETSLKNTQVTAYGPGSLNNESNIGVFYNICAASAGSYCYNSSMIGADLTNDICPKGWHMPSSGGADGDYWKLCTAVKGSNCASEPGVGLSMTASDSNSLQYALSTPLSGYVSASALGQESDGYYWSSTVYTNNNYTMFILSIKNSVVATQSTTSRHNGSAVRCLLK